MIQLSIIIPVLNEAEHIVHRLQALRHFLEKQKQLIEVVIVDGGSEDNTVELAKPYANSVITSDKGRALQMNAGAAIAKGEWLLFLHIDTELTSIDFLELELLPASKSSRWGFYPLKLSGSQTLFRIIERMISWRSRLTSVATGDQCLFVKRNLFELIGGFAEIPLMEDVEMTKRLRRLGKPYCVKTPVITSSRRWEKHGIIYTVLFMWYLRALYFFGVSPEKLARKYY